MSHHAPLTPEHLSRSIEDYFAERQTNVLPSGEQTKDGRRLSWCGDVLEYLLKGLLNISPQEALLFRNPFLVRSDLWMKNNWRAATI